MITYCPKCDNQFDDAYRDTECPHYPFRANDGTNRFGFNMNSVGPKFEFVWYAVYDIGTDRIMALPVRIEAAERADKSPHLVRLSRETGDKLNDIRGLDCRQGFTNPRTEDDIKAEIARATQ